MYDSKLKSNATGRQIWSSRNLTQSRADDMMADDNFQPHSGTRHEALNEVEGKTALEGSMMAKLDDIDG